MRIGKDSGSKKLGKVRKFVSPAPRVIVGTMVIQLLLFVGAVGFMAAILLRGAGAGLRRSPVLLSPEADWAIPFALLVVGELLRRSVNRRLMSLHEDGLSYMERRALRRIAWDDIERADLGPGTCRLRLRGGEELDLPGPLARSDEVREAVSRRPEGRSES